MRRALKYRKGAIAHLARLDVWSLEKRQRPAETRTFTQDGISFTLTIRRPDTADYAAADEQARELVERHITGVDGIPAVPFPGGVKLTRALAKIMANAYEMQCPENPADRYPLEELIMLSDKLPEAWGEAQIWIAQKMGAAPTPGNERAAP